MWMYFLFCLFAKSLLAASENTTTNQPWTSTERNNVSTKLVEETTSSQSNRRGYERNVLVVLPVMQGDSELSNSNLQMLYTKTPVTAIINDQPAIRSNGSGRRSTTARRPSTSTTPLTSTVSTAAAYSTSSSTKKILAQTTRAAAPNKRDDSRHPYTDFLSTKPAYQTHKSPLDYGYPETFKFVQELNELPKNHKPEWAQSELAEAETKKSTTTEGSTKGSPFQMFESVKPLEINKLLSLKPVAIPVTDSIFEETAVKNKQGTTEPSFRVTKRPFNKRPIKKPQKVKLSPQKLSDAELAPFIPFIVTSTDNMFNEISSQSTVKSTQTSTSSSSSSTTAALTSQTTQAMSSSTQMPVSEQSTSKSDVELYDAARYSALFAKSTKVFLPTPYISSSDRSVIRPIQSSTLGGPSSESWSPMTSPLTTTTARITTSTPTTTAATTSTSTTTSSPFSPNFNWANINTPVIPVMETNTPKTEPQVKPSDLISLTKILDEHFDKQSHGILQSTTAKPHFPADMLTNDMKNMLIALGLLKPEQDSSLPLLLITSTVAPSTIDPQYFNNLFIKKELVTPTIDPNSYLNFKKLPINYEKPQVSNDMRDLLSSFGLLPSAKSTHLGTNSILTRVSRQQKAETSDHSMDMLDDKMRETLENLGLMKQMALQMNRKGHVFQPSMHLEKLADPQQVMKINSALETIRLLSKSKEVQNLPIEELEQKLRNATALLREENFLDGNITDTPELTTELLSTMKNFIFYSTRTTPAQQKSTVSHSTTPSLKTVKTTQAFTFDTSPTTSSSISFFKRRNNSSISYSNVNSRKRGNTRITSTAITPSEDSTTSFTTISTTPSPSTSTLSPTIASTTVLKNIFTKTLTTPSTTTSVKAKSVATSNSPKPTTTFELKFEIVTSTSASTSIVTPATVSLFSEEHNEVNYTPDASSVSFVKLSHNKNNTKVVMSPPPNPLSIEELQYLLESNRKDVKRQQPQEESSTSSTTASIDAGSTQNISSTEDSSSISNISKTSDSDNTIVISSSENSSASSTTTSGNSDNSNGITEESSIKVDDTSDNNAPLEALADSFGGENEEQVDSWQANAKPNGVYFLLDWNTFLSVGEEDKRPIRIRFSPRAGNPRNFMPIKVP